ncbi:hypothetical protein TWF730_008603 [Orbilia blumenaviensis]|uniref:Uncharacterized protein n=1 Tax=Orbilia blumenaviensis TaxID=1796055 RepID=A0AAV9V2U8_9PEZI
MSSQGVRSDQVGKQAQVEAGSARVSGWGPDEREEGKERRAAKTTAKTTRKKRKQHNLRVVMLLVQKFSQVSKRSGTRHFSSCASSSPHSCIGHKGHCKRQKSTSAYMGREEEQASIVCFLLLAPLEHSMKKQEYGSVEACCSREMPERRKKEKNHICAT